MECSLLSPAPHEVPAGPWAYRQDLDTACGTVLDPQQKRQWATLSVVSVTVDRGEDLKLALGPAQVPKPANPHPHPELLSSLLKLTLLAQPLPARGPQGPAARPPLSAEAQDPLGEWRGSPG